jgi:hypothetical protein
MSFLILRDTSPAVAHQMKILDQQVKHYLMSNATFPLHTFSYSKECACMSNRLGSYSDV